MRITDYIAPVHPPRLTWQDQVPEATDFGDVYYSKLGGLAEARHVFLGGNALPERLPTKSHFCVGETGFGTGLNFLATWELWQRVAPSHSTLEFISVEKHPLLKTDAAKALAAFPDLAPLAAELLNQWPLAMPGYHRLVLDGGRVRLTLLFGEAQHLLPTLSGPMDAWFLDGFAPRQNEDLWGSDVLQQLARLSHAGTTLATFTAASAVRRGLEAVGFKMEKVRGFAHKREMLRGEFAGPSTGQTTSRPPQRALIIGAGLAGSWAAHQLHRRGWQVEVLEAGPTIAAGASGNQVGGFYPRLTADIMPQGQFYQQAFLFAQNQYQRLIETNANIGELCSVLRLAKNQTEAERHQKIIATHQPDPQFCQILSPQEATAQAGIPLTQSALYFPRGGWLSPRQICETLLQGIPVHLNCKATGLSQTKTGWQVKTPTGSFDTPVVILANAVAAADLVPHLAVSPVRGQVSYVPSTPASQKLKTVLCHDGYIAPAVQGEHCMGSTYDRHSASLEIRPEDHADIHARLATHLPDLAATLASPPIHQWANIRTVTPDRFPVVGPAPNAPSLYITTAHGSHGLTSTPLAAEIIASHIAGDTPATDPAVMRQLRVGRFGG